MNAAVLFPGDVSLKDWVFDRNNADMSDHRETRTQVHSLQPQKRRNYKTNTSAFDAFKSLTSQHLTAKHKTKVSTHRLKKGCVQVIKVLLAAAAAAVRRNRTDLRQTSALLTNMKRGKKDTPLSKKNTNVRDSADHSPEYSTAGSTHTCPHVPTVTMVDFQTLHTLCTLTLLS